MPTKNNPINSIVESDCLSIISETNFSALRNKSILLTGSNGFFGRYLVSTVFLLNKKGFNITLYCMSLHKPIPEIAKIIKQDKHIIPLKRNVAKKIAFSKKVDYIFHAACYAQPQKFIEDGFTTIELNVITTKNLLEIAKKNNARFLYFSSAETYGDIPKEIVPVPETYNGNSSTLGVRAIYGESKRLGETVCAMYRRTYNLHVYIARISHVYGPGITKHDKRVLGEFIRKAQDDRKITLMDQGESIKTFGYIKDAVQMLWKIIIDGKDIVYNVGGVDTISIKELAESVARYYDVPVKIPKKNTRLQHIGTDPAIVKLDLSKFSKEFGAYTPIHLEEGIKRTLDYLLPTTNTIGQKSGES